jgi:hypothetical protein
VLTWPPCVDALASTVTGNGAGGVGVESAAAVPA